MTIEIYHVTFVVCHVMLIVCHVDEPVPRWRKIKKSNQRDTVLHKDCIFRKSNIREKNYKTK